MIPISLSKAEKQRLSVFAHGWAMLYTSICPVFAVIFICLFNLHFILYRTTWCTLLPFQIQHDSIFAMLFLLSKGVKFKEGEIVILYFSFCAFFVHVQATWHSYIRLPPSLNLYNQVVIRLDIYSSWNLKKHRPKSYIIASTMNILCYWRAFAFREKSWMSAMTYAILQRKPYI